MYKQFFCITNNSFAQIVRKPLYLILCALSVLFIGLFPHLALFTFGEELKFMIESSLGIFMFMGILVSVSATNLICTNEIERGNLLLLFVKPVSRLCFILAKFCAVVHSVLLMGFIDMCAFFVSQRMLSVATVNISKIFIMVLLMYFLSIVFVFFIGALSSYFLRRNFVSDTVFALFFVFVLLFVIFGFVSDDSTVRNFYQGVSFVPVFAFLYVFMVVCLIAAFSLLCSLFLSFVPNLIFTFIFLFIGLVWGYMFANFVPEKFMIIKSIIPDMNYFWLNALEEINVKNFIEQSVYTCLYTLSYIGFIICITCGLFSFKEINDKGI